MISPAGNFFIKIINWIRFQVGLKVISFFIALTLWVVVFGSRNIEITKEVPFEVVMNDDQILVDPVPEKITFKLSGPKAFLRSVMNRIEEPIRANIKAYKTGTISHRIFSDSFKLPPGVKVQSVNPNIVQIKVEELRQKVLPIKLETTGQLLSGVKLLRTEMIPTAIKVRGPKNRLILLSNIPNIPIDLSSIRDTSVIPLAFDFKGFGVEPLTPLPEVLLEVQGRGQAYRVRHVPLKINSNLKSSTVDHEVTVIVRTATNDPLKIEAEKIQAEVDMRDYPPGEYYRWIQVELPEKLNLVRVIPSMTKITIK